MSAYSSMSPTLITNAYGVTIPREQLFHKAVRENDTATVKKLLSAGVDVDCLFYNWTPLMLAINKNNEELALMLVRRGASVTYRDELGNAPLHEAVRKNMIEVVKALSKAKCGIDDMMPCGYTPLACATQRGIIELVQVLIETGGANVNHPSTRLETPLYLAALEGQLNIAKLLISHGTDIDQPATEAEQTPLMAAVIGEHEEVVKLILKSLKTVESLTVQDKDGWTALMYAVTTEDEELVNLIANTGKQEAAAPANKDDQRALEIAQESGNEAIIKIIARVTPPRVVEETQETETLADAMEIPVDAMETAADDSELPRLPDVAIEAN